MPHERTALSNLRRLQNIFSAIFTKPFVKNVDVYQQRLPKVVIIVLFIIFDAKNYDSFFGCF